MKILFLHGWQSVPIYLAHHGPEVINPALPDPNRNFLRGRDDG